MGKEKKKKTKHTRIKTKPKPKPNSNQKGVWEKAKAFMKEAEVLKHLGRSVGSYFLGPGGAQLGAHAGSLAAHITGLGSYHIRENHMLGLGGSPTSTIPTFGDPGSIVLSRSEYIEDITSSVEFSVRKYALNPGRSHVFPWGSILAGAYENWEPLGMVFYFKTTSGNAVGDTNTALGSVIMATDLDALDPEFTSKRQMEGYHMVTSGRPSSDIVHGVECSPKYNNRHRFNVRTGGASVNGDIRLDDLGNFYLATEGMQAASVIGELWVSYKIRLTLPREVSVAGEHLLAMHAKGTPITTGDPLSGIVVQTGSNLPLVFDHDAALTVTFPREGRFLVYIYVYSPDGTTGGYSSSPNHLSLDSATVNIWYTGQGRADAGGGGTSTEAINTWVVDIYQAGARIEFCSGSQFVTGSTPATDFLVSQLPQVLADSEHPKGMEARIQAAVTRALKQASFEPRRVPQPPPLYLGDEIVLPVRYTRSELLGWINNLPRRSPAGYRETLLSLVGGGLQVYDSGRYAIKSAVNAEQEVKWMDGLPMEPGEQVPQAHDAEFVLVGRHTSNSSGGQSAPGEPNTPHPNHTTLAATATKQARMTPDSRAYAEPAASRR